MKSYNIVIKVVKTLYSKIFFCIKTCYLFVIIYLYGFILYLNPLKCFFTHFIPSEPFLYSPALTSFSVHKCMLRIQPNMKIKDVQKCMLRTQEHFNFCTNSFFCNFHKFWGFGRILTLYQNVDLKRNKCSKIQFDRERFSSQKLTPIL